MLLERSSSWLPLVVRPSRYEQYLGLGVLRRYTRWSVVSDWRPQCLEARLERHPRASACQKPKLSPGFHISRLRDWQSLRGCCLCGWRILESHVEILCKETSGQTMAAANGSFTPGLAL